MRVVDAVKDYSDLMVSLFNFDLIKKLVQREGNYL